MFKGKVKSNSIVILKIKKLNEPEAGYEYSYSISSAPPFWIIMTSFGCHYFIYNHRNPSGFCILEQIRPIVS